MPDETSIQPVAAGKIEIHDEVIKTIAGLAASKVQGVAALKGGFIEGAKQAVTGKRDFSAGVEVKREPAEQIILELHVVIEYDYKIEQVATAIQAAVKERVEAITGRPVGAVNILVADIRLPEEIQKQA